MKDFAYRDLKASNNKPASDANAKAKSDAPEFMRVVSDKDEVLESLQTAIATYQINDGEFKGAQIDLVGAVHVGEASYYKELNRRFKTYDAVLFELVADPDIRIAGRKDQEGVINQLAQCKWQ